MVISNRQLNRAAPAMHPTTRWNGAARPRQARGMKTKLSEAAPTSTLDAGEKRQISLINAQNGGVPSLISYPARPIQGGKLDRAPKKIGLWYTEPKYNDWRAVVRCPNGTMWNRRGKRSSIVGELDIALRVLLSRSRYALFNCASDERSQCRPA